MKSAPAGIACELEAPEVRRRRLLNLAGAAGAGVVLVAVIAAGLAGASGDDAPRRAAALWTLLDSAPWAALWLAAAVGWGEPLRHLLLPGAAEDRWIQPALGVALLLFLDTVLARAGLLAAAGGVAAWGLLLAGLALLAFGLLRRRPCGSTLPDGAAPWLLIAAAPAVAVLLLAAATAPGWLWASEFGGYDALSYHLQLPKEWLALGRQTGLDHNVYAFFPSSVESAYLHLAVLRGDAIDAACAAQILHAALAGLTALLTLRLGAILGGRPGAPSGAVAAVLVLGTPWVVVVGSLAYDEMAATLFLAGGLLVLADEPSRAHFIRRALALGVLAGAAGGAKLTATGFVALPLLLLLLIIERRPLRRGASAGLAMIGASLLLLAPWLIDNALRTGNPLFPFAVGFFGHGHWTAAQSDIFAAAHRSGLSTGARLVEGWNQLLRYGFGASPVQGEPWRPQWSILPWLAGAGAAVGLIGTARRRACAALLLVVAVQVVFWLAFTHVKSRFMLPFVVPAALLAAIGAAAALDRVRTPGPRAAVTAVLALVLLAYAFLPVRLYRREAGGQPAAALGAIDLFTGDLHAAEIERRRASGERVDDLLTAAPMAYWINHRLAPDARIATAGEAAPFYYRAPNLSYRTTWDRGPVSAALREAPDDDNAFVRGLRDAGFTHLLVDPVMLAVWDRSGWNDPALTAERVLGAAEEHAVLLHRDPNGKMLFELRRDEPATRMKRARERSP